MVPGLFFLFIVVGGYAAFYGDNERLHEFVELAFVVIVAALIVRWIVRSIDEWLRVGTHRGRVERLQAIVDVLDHGTIDGAGFYSGGLTKVAGELERRAVTLSVRFEERPLLAFEMRLDAGSPQVFASRPGLLDRLRDKEPLLVAAQAVPSEELREPLRFLLLERGFLRLSVAAGILRVEKPLASEEELATERVLSVLRTLARMARVLGRARDEGAARDEPRPETRCPYCHAGLSKREGVEACRTCSTLHHSECLVQAGGCSVFGCAGGRRVRVAPSIKQA